MAADALADEPATVHRSGGQQDSRSLLNRMAEGAMIRAGGSPVHTPLDFARSDSAGENEPSLLSSCDSSFEKCLSVVSHACAAQGFERSCASTRAKRRDGGECLARARRRRLAGLVLVGAQAPESVQTPNERNERAQLPAPLHLCTSRIRPTRHREVWSRDRLLP